MMTIRFAAFALLSFAACGPGDRTNPTGPGPGDDDPSPEVCPRCSPDNNSVIDCQGNAVACPLDQLCSEGACMNACAAAEANNSSVGCEYYAVDMDAAQGPPQDACFTVFVANTSKDNVHINVEFGGAAINLGQFAKLPNGQGQSLTYAPFNPAQGLRPGEVAILFLGYSAVGFPAPNVACPVAAAIGTEAQIPGTGLGKGFHITTDQPVVAYQMLPYGGGAAAATGASLLLPTSAWGTNYVAASAYEQIGGSMPPIQIAQGPSYNIIAKEDDTIVTLKPRANIAAGGGLPAMAAGTPTTITLMKGQHAQITSSAAPLSGTAVDANKPIGVFAGHQIMSIDQCCGDHGEQMLAPVRALGSEYVAAPHPQRKVGEQYIYRIYGAVNATLLTYDPPGIGPESVNQGQIHEIRATQPFKVTSQDAAHPFQMFTYMTGAGEQGQGGIGDPDVVRLIPPVQYMKHYVFFTDPTYPFTNLTVVRKRTDQGFADVELACMGNISSWSPVGTSGDYEIAFVKIVDHWNGMNGCNNGVNQMTSQGQFGVWVWGWGSEDTNTGWVSYGYPAGENVLPVNDVIVY